MSPERFQLSAALVVQSFLQEAANNGIERLDELTPEAILQLCPSPDTLGRSLEIMQHVLDNDLEDEFDCDHALALFVIHDAGNKKKDKLQQRLLAAYDLKLKKVVLKHVAASKVGGLSLADVVIEDLERIRVQLPRVYGSVQDNAPDVGVTFVNSMRLRIPHFVGVGCVLHILNLMIMRSILVAFGEQRKPGDGEKGAGANGVIRVGFMVHYLISLEPELWRKWALKNGFGAIAFIPTGASEGRWWSVQQACQEVFRSEVGSIRQWGGCRGRVQ